MKQTFPIEWIDCISCATIVKDQSMNIPWISSCYVDIEKKTVTYEYDDTITSPKQINTQLNKYWYTLIYSPINTEETKQIKKSEEYRNLLLSIPLVTVALIDMIRMIWADQWVLTEMGEWLHLFFDNFLLVSATIMLFIVWQKYLLAVWRYFHYGVVSMDTLVWLWTWTAYVYSFVVSSFAPSLSHYIDTSILYYEAVIVIIWFIALWKFLEHRAMAKSWQAIKALLTIQAKKALYVDTESNWEREIDVTELQIWNTIRIKSWSKVPLDCIIITWSAEIDESMITGETMPILKQVWDQLIWWTININGSLLATVTATSEAWYLAKIISIVTTAQQSRPAIQELVDRIMRWFIPLVLCIALGSALLWFVFWSAWVWDKYISIAVASFIWVLVIACPCGIWLATPMAVTTWLGHLAKNGILCKDATWLLKLRKASTFIFDKTWTLTEWKPRVVAEKYYGNKEEIACILYAIEAEANHPLATAITDHLISYRKDIKIEQFTTLIGSGVSAMIEWVWYRIASPKYLRAQWYILDEEIITAYSSQAMSPICLANNDTVLAILWLADTIKPEAIATIKELQNNNKEVVIVSGDHYNVVESIANQLWIKKRYAEVAPEDKATIVQSLSNTRITQETPPCDDWCCSVEQSTKKKRIKIDNFIVMVGDGINDAPALAQADVGIAMSTGTDIAIESSDITLLHGDISKLLKAIKISTLTHSAITQNLFWAFSYNIIWIPLAAWAFYLPFGILLNPAFEWAAMAMSDLAIIANSIRLQQKKV